jgi:anti-sigma B factor antagonist
MIVALASGAPQPGCIWRFVAWERSVDISVRRRFEVQLLHLRGDLRLGDPVTELGRTLDEILESGDTRIVIDLSEVPMIDSSGIGVLVKYLATARKRGGGLRLVKPSDFTSKTLRTVGLLRIFEVFDDESEAVDTFK